MKKTILPIAFAVLSSVAAAKDPSNDKLANWVRQRVHQWQPTRDERRLDEIGWARNIREAEQLAREHTRPVFLFTHDGRIATGRC
jgi:hypothetical protein